MHISDKARKIIGAVATILVLLTFILLIGAPGIKFVYRGYANNIAGSTVLFGNGATKGSPLAIVAWVLALIGSSYAIVNLFASFVFKDEKISRYLRIVGLFVALAILVGGVLVFTSLMSWVSTNGLNGDNYKLTIWWIMAAASAFASSCLFFLLSSDLKK